MSGNFTDTSGASDNYNAGAAHDTGFYDPDIHDNQIVAVFENETAANLARDALMSAGVPGNQVAVTAKTAGDAAPGVSQVEDTAIGDRILTGFMSLFGSHGDHHDYTHAVDQGHAMVVVTPAGDTDRHRVIQVLEQSHPIDFDAKLAEWRQAGYDNSGAARSPEHAQTAQRENLPTQSEGETRRVRSYVAGREAGVGMAGGVSTKPVGLGAGGMGTGGDVTNATPGATSSGTNSPRT